MGSDKEVETEPFDGSNKHDQATQKLCPKRAKENEGQPLCHNAEFQKNSFSMIHVGCAFVQCAWSYLQQWFQTFLHAKDRLLNIFGSLACAPTRSYTNKLARPDLGHAQACAVSSQRSSSALGSWKVWKGAGGFTWPPLRPPWWKVGQRAHTRHTQRRARLPRFLVARGGPTRVRINIKRTNRVGPIHDHTCTCVSWSENSNCSNYQQKTKSTAFYVTY